MIQQKIGVLSINKGQYLFFSDFFNTIYFIIYLIFIDVRTRNINIFRINLFDVLIKYASKTFIKNKCWTSSIKKIICGETTKEINLFPFLYLKPFPTC